MMTAHDSIAALKNTLMRRAALAGLDTVIDHLLTPLSRAQT